MKGHRPKIRKPIGRVPPPFNHYLTMISPNTFVPVAVVFGKQISMCNSTKNNSPRSCPTCLAHNLTLGGWAWGGGSN